MFESLNETWNLVTEGRAGSENLKICVTSLMDDPLVPLRNLRTVPKKKFNYKIAKNHINEILRPYKEI